MGCCESYPDMNQDMDQDAQRRIDYWDRVARDAEKAQEYAYRQIEAILNEEDRFIRGEGL